jgi:hypothetical protein
VRQVSRPCSVGRDVARLCRYITSDHTAEAAQPVVVPGYGLVKHGNGDETPNIEFGYYLERSILPPEIRQRDPQEAVR